MKTIEFKKKSDYIVWLGGKIAKWRKEIREGEGLRRTESVGHLIKNEK